MRREILEIARYNERQRLRDASRFVAASIAVLAVLRLLADVLNTIVFGPD